MSKDQAERIISQLLGLLGRVDPPADTALAAAREALWSAVADEMLSAPPPGDAGQAHQAGPAQQIIRRQPDPGA